MDRIEIGTTKFLGKQMTPIVIRAGPPHARP
jgi:hypothetical protein